MSCKQCAHLDVPLTKDGRRVVRPRAAYQCGAPTPPLPVLPASMTLYHYFRWPPSRRFMCGKEGDGCPTFVQYVKAAKT
jgi:hypothetical protein